jgi:uncharacterized protein (TIRG00374 family)
MTLMEESARPRRSWRRWLNLVWFGLALLLLWLALRTVDPAQVWALMRGLQPWQIALLLVANGAVLFSFSLRWWLLLRAQGYHIPYAQLVGYRLATFAVSYFTPGPHFGGEPLQVWLITSRHGVPASAALATVVMDKTLEMAVNFVFLLTAMLVVTASSTQAIAGPVLALGLLLPLAPILLFVALANGRRPLTGLLAGYRRAVRSWPQLWQPADAGSELDAKTSDRLGETLFAAETEGALLARRPSALAAALGASLLSWVGIIGEYWLMTSVLGLGLTLPQALTALLAARLALLLPLPAAVGALEASQIAAMSLLGFSPATGATLALLIRLRDVTLGIVGLGLAGHYLHRRPPLSPQPAVQPLDEPQRR